MDEATRVTRQAAEDRELYADGFRNCIWDDWHWDFGQQTFPLPGDWRESILRFKDAGIDMDDFGRAVEKAMTSRKVDPPQKFRYMCGVLWSVISERQKIAMEIVQGEGEDGA
jgi:hypothetical protein